MDVQDGVILESEKKIKSKSLKVYLKNIESHYIKSSHLEELCKFPKEGEQYRIITEKQFNAFALLITILKSRVIDELYIAIYRINEPTVTAIINLIESGVIKKGGFIISSFFNQTKRPEKWAVVLKNYCDQNPNFSHCYTHNHSKIVACKTDKDEYIVFEGSGNMSDNARIEQYIYENNKQCFDFHKEWMTKILK
jgi:hypothetical protein